MNTETNSDILTRITNAFTPGTVEHDALVAGAAALRNDPMDIAYLSMGALQALDENGKAAYYAINNGGYSQSCMIQEMLTVCHPAIVKHWRETDGEYEGCYLYDVVEPLGMWFIREWHRREKAPTESEALNTARKYAE